MRKSEKSTEFMSSSFFKLFQRSVKANLLSSTRYRIFSFYPFNFSWIHSFCSPVLNLKIHHSALQNYHMHHPSIKHHSHGNRCITDGRRDEKYNRERHNFYGSIFSISTLGLVYLCANDEGIYTILSCACVILVLFQRRIESFCWLLKTEISHH